MSDDPRIALLKFYLDLWRQGRDEAVVEALMDRDQGTGPAVAVMLGMSLPEEEALNLVDQLAAKAAAKRAAAEKASDQFVDKNEMVPADHVEQPLTMVSPDVPVISDEMGIYLGVHVLGDGVYAKMYDEAKRRRFLGRCTDEDGQRINDLGRAAYAAWWAKRGIANRYPLAGDGVTIRDPITANGVQGAHPSVADVHNMDARANSIKGATLRDDSPSGLIDNSDAANPQKHASQVTILIDGITAQKRAIAAIAAKARAEALAAIRDGDKPAADQLEWEASTAPFMRGVAAGMAQRSAEIARMKKKIEQLETVLAFGDDGATGPFEDAAIDWSGRINARGGVDAVFVLECCQDVTARARKVIVEFDDAD